MRNVFRRVWVLLSMVAALIALQLGPVAMARADDVLPNVRFTTTSGAPLQNGATYGVDRKSTRLNSSHSDRSRMPSSA